jgi:hypothetical protein
MRTTHDGLYDGRAERLIECTCDGGGRMLEEVVAITERAGPSARAVFRQARTALTHSRSLHTELRRLHRRHRALLEAAHRERVARVAPPPGFGGVTAAVDPAETGSQGTAQAAAETVAAATATTREQQQQPSILKRQGGEKELKDKEKREAEKKETLMVAQRSVWELLSAASGAEDDEAGVRAAEAAVQGMEQMLEALAAVEGKASEYTAIVQQLQQEEGIVVRMP